VDRSVASIKLLGMKLNWMIGTKGSPNRASKQRGSLIESQTRKHANHKANM